MEAGDTEDGRQIWEERVTENKHVHQKQFDTDDKQLGGTLSTKPGLTITFHRLHYTVNVKRPDRMCGSCSKEILHDINGIFPPGMNAILGPTGGGKSSLLDVLAGRKDPDGLQGLVLVDGRRQPKNFKCMAGYVVQDDVVMGTLTVRENIMFSANVRLPPSVSTKEKQAKVEETIRELGLSECANSKIGNEYIRGVSGGERKRTSIGIELIISPNVLFLDEPTSGLDASTANAVMSLLSRLSIEGNRTIIFSIHQPRYSIYKLFDRLMLLAGGRTIYHGPTEAALEYFSHIGYECELHNNPPDFFLDVINGDSRSVRRMLSVKGSANDQHVHPSDSVNEHSTPVQSMESFKAAVKWNKVDHGSRKLLENDDIKENPRYSDVFCPVKLEQKHEPSLVHQLNKRFVNSTWYKSVYKEIHPIELGFLGVDKLGKGDHPDRGEYVTGFWTQLWHLSKRSLTNIFRNPQSFLLYLMANLALAFIDSAIYFRLGNDAESAIQNRVGAFFFIVSSQIFGNLPALEIFIKERSIFMHESASGFYRVSAYFFSKIFFDLIPMRVIPLTVLVCIIYFTIGLQLVLEKFFIFYLGVVLASMSAAAIGFAFGASIPVFAVANVVVCFCYVVMMVFGGVIVNVKTLADWLGWCQYLSIFRYSINMLSINELKDIVIYQTIPNSTIKIAIYDAGSEYLDSQAIKHDTVWELWQNAMAITVMTIGIMFVAYVQLRRVRRIRYH